MDFITFFILAAIIALLVLFFGGMLIASLPIVVFIGVPMFLLWMLIYHTVAGVIVSLVLLAVIGLAKAAKS